MATANFDSIITITIGGKPIPVTGFATDDVIFSTPTRGLLHRAPCKNTVKNALPIKGKSFAEYLHRRMVKDNLGFVPTDDVWTGVTDCKSYIMAIAPQKAYQFLVYAHELGHCKSKQYEQKSYGWLDNTVDEWRIRNEYNAWMWALKYYRRLGFTLCSEGKAIVKEAFKSYLSNYRGNFAQEMTDTLDKKYDIGFNYKVPVFEMVGFINDYKMPQMWFDELAETVVEKPKPKNWKPWHDIKEKQTKKAWKNQR